MSVIELRVAITTADFERLKRFYCDGLGLEPAEIWTSEGARQRRQTGPSPVVTPWRHHNVRVEDPDGLQVTLFQIL
jgi:hypothetical protein